jgi:hypothetical protein
MSINYVTVKGGWDMIIILKVWGFVGFFVTKGEGV